MIENRSAPLGDVIPSLIYDDLNKAIEWLCDVFGFTERLRITGGDGKAGHAQLAIGLGGVILGLSRKEGRIAFQPPRPNEVSQTVMVRVVDVDRHYERAKQRGAKIILPPADHPYGERQYSAEDPEGHRWAFSQAIADVKPEEWGATVSRIGNKLELLPRPRFCYLEIPAADPRRSAGFYAKVFGWNIRNKESERPSFDDATGNISGAWVTGRQAARDPGLMAYIWVDSIDSTVSMVAAQGGEVVEAPHLDSPGGHWIATFRDPSGNLMGLYQEGSR